MSTCADCGEIINVRCAHRLLQSERANREETERQFQAKVAEIGALDDKLAAERARSAALMVEVERLREALLGLHDAYCTDPIALALIEVALSQSSKEKT